MADPGISRRGLLAGLGAAVVVGAAAGPLRRQLRALAHSTPQPTILGELQPPGPWGVRVPKGFSVQTIGVTGELVDGTPYPWHPAPDGATCFPARRGGGHVLVSNSEVPNDQGGVGAIEFDANGRIVSARRILAGTNMNCSGGPTPWGTWLSCEENGSDGIVWECDPYGGPARPLPAMGHFNHEAAAVDALTGHVYLTEDTRAGRLYRFSPRDPGDLTMGVLEAAVVADGSVTWRPVSPDEPDRSPETTPFAGGEGAVIDGRRLLFNTKLDRRIWEVDLDRSTISIFHDCRSVADSPLTHLDGLAVHPTTRHVFVAEDGGDMGLGLLAEWNGEPVIAQVVEFVGHTGSEVTGPAFSPDGRSLYLSSQRGVDGRGVTVRIDGPFDQAFDHVAEIDRGATVGRKAQRLGSG